MTWVREPSKYIYACVCAISSLFSPRVIGTVPWSYTRRIGSNLSRCSQKYRVRRQNGTYCNIHQLLLSSVIQKVILFGIVMSSFISQLPYYSTIPMLSIDFNKKNIKLMLSLTGIKSCQFIAWHRMETIPLYLLCRHEVVCYLPSLNYE